MSTETTEIPQGVMEILRKRAEGACSTKEDGTYAAITYVTRGTPEAERQWLETAAADWLSGLNAMRLAPWEN